MSVIARTAPTRHGLLQTRRRLLHVEKGIELLRRKRQALVAELFRLARPAVGAREQILAQADSAYSALVEACAAHGRTEISALGWPGREIEVTLRHGNVWGIPTTEVELPAPVRRTLAARGTAPPLTGPAAAAAATAFERLLELLLDAASREVLVQRVGDALARASRQLNVLDHRLKPALTERAAQVQQVLDEREREDHARLRRLTRHGPARGASQP